jgi:4-hydroxy-4-methyl-2-oxoglutarate aldolase
MRHRQLQLFELRRYSTPTIANALECFGVDPASGYTDASVMCATPEVGSVIGYAATVTIRSSRGPSASEPRVSLEDYLHYIESIDSPTLVVMEDLDPSPVGSFWGEVMGNAHRALGCVGTLTNGAVRDVPELRRLGFFALASRLVVSHAHVHATRLGGRVCVGGLEVDEGELLHADMHGALRIPASIDLEELVNVAASLEALEREMFSLAQSPEFSVKAFVATQESAARRWPNQVQGQESAKAL